MDAAKEFSDFIEPPDNTVLWRYLVPYKFESLLEKSQHYFTCVERMSDKNEGMFPLLNGDFSERTDLSDEDKKRASANYLNGVNKLREIYNRIYINCWHIARDENLKMWNDYVIKHGRHGVVIKTTYRRLRDSLVGPLKVRMGVVDYVDHARHRIDESHGLSFFQPFLIKSKDLDFEKELRMIYLNDTGMKMEVVYGQRAPVIPLGRIDLPNHVMIPCKLNKLILEVRVSPESDRAYYEQIKAIREKKKLTFPIFPSKFMKLDGA